MREKVTALLADALSGGSGDANRQKARAIATEIEQGVFAHEGSVSAEYKKQFQMLKFNLTKNANLRDDVMTGKTAALKLATMSAADLASEDLKKKRDAAAEASLVETINSKELQQLKQAAEGINLRKTDQGLELMPDIDKKKEEEADQKRREREQREREEEQSARERAAQEAAHARTIVAVDTASLKDYNKEWEWKPSIDDDDDARAGSDGDDPARGFASSPTLDLQISADPDLLPDAEDAVARVVAGQGEAAMPGHHVWSGRVVPQASERSGAAPEPFELDAFLLSGPGVHDLMPAELRVRGSVKVEVVQDYVAKKTQDPSRIRTVYKLCLPQEGRAGGSEPAFGKFLDAFRRENKCVVLIDSKKLLLYAVPPHTAFARALVGPGEDLQPPGGCLVAVSISARRDRAAQAAVSIQDAAANVGSDFRAATLGSKETMLKLLASVFCKKSLPGCNLRATLVAGENLLARIPRELGFKGPAGLDQVLEYLLSQRDSGRVSVLEMEPEGEADEEAYASLAETMLEKRRAGILLDSPTTLLYLIPPADEAGQLLTPPSDSCPSMLGVMLSGEPGQAQ